MTTREEALAYCLTFPNVYQDAPFHDDNWQLVRYRKNKKTFALVYEREGNIWVNVKVAPNWRDFWRQAYEAVIPGCTRIRSTGIRLSLTVPFPKTTSDA